MQSVRVAGRFIDQSREPIEGTIEFIPSKLWLDENGATYPVPAPKVSLDQGIFSVEVIRTDQHGLPWFYQVASPVGKWTVHVTEDGPLWLSDLLPKRFTTP